MRGGLGTTWCGMGNWLGVKAASEYVWLAGDCVVIIYIDVCFDLKLDAFVFTPYLGMRREDAGRRGTEVCLRYMLGDDLMAWLT